MPYIVARELTTSHLLLRPFRWSDFEDRFVTIRG
jgi:hypothetical protein